MAFSVIIPARYASQRLPGKPLRMIAGKTMIQHVYERALQSEASRVIIATDDARIREAAEAFGAPVCMTDPDHPSGTDRLEEVVRVEGFYADDIVVNVQGDEPLIPPRLINQVAHNLAAEADASIATLCEAIDTPAEVFDPNVVKVVKDARGFALYFSRAPIPWHRDHFSADDRAGQMLDGDYFRHIGIYAYRVKFLRHYVQWPPCGLEQIERLEQLRALYQGERIHVDVADETPPAGVDTEADLARVEALIQAAAQ